MPNIELLNKNKNRMDHKVKHNNKEYIMWYRYGDQMLKKNKYTGRNLCIKYNSIQIKFLILLYLRQVNFMISKTSICT